LEAAELYEIAGNKDQAALLYTRLKNWSQVSKLIQYVTQPKVHIAYAKVNLYVFGVFPYRNLMPQFHRPKSRKGSTKKRLAHMSWQVILKVQSYFVLINYIVHKMLYELHEDPKVQREPNWLESKNFGRPLKYALTIFKCSDWVLDSSWNWVTIPQL